MPPGGRGDHDRVGPKGTKNGGRGTNLCPRFISLCLYGATTMVVTFILKSS